MLVIYLSQCVRTINPAKGLLKCPSTIDIRQAQPRMWCGPPPKQIHTRCQCRYHHQSADPPKWEKDICLAAAAMVVAMSTIRWINDPNGKTTCKAFQFRHWWSREKVRVVAYDTTHIILTWIIVSTTFDAGPIQFTIAGHRDLYISPTTTGSKGAVQLDTV